MTNTFWQDQMQAASNHAEQVIHTVGDILEKKPHKGKGVAYQIHTLAREQFDTVKKCPHLDPRTPQILFYFLGMGWVGCDRCATKAVQTFQPDNCCDLCGKESHDGIFTEHNVQSGNAWITAHLGTCCSSP